MTVSQFQISRVDGDPHVGAERHELIIRDRDRLQRSAEDLLQVWDDLVPSVGGMFEDDLEGASDANLLEFLDALAAHHRQLTSVLAVAANEIAVRSRPSLDGERLTFRYGYRGPEHLVSERAHIDQREAKAMVKVGRGIIGGRGLTGDRVPALTEHVAAAVRNGGLGIAHASEIVALVRRLSPKPHVQHDDLGEGERMLVETAQEGMPLPDFRKVIARWEAHLDPDGVAPKIENQRAQRGLSFRTDTDTGMTYLRGKFDAESAAYVTHALESYTTGVIRDSRGFNHTDEDGADGGVDAGVASGVHFRATAEHALHLRDHIDCELRSISQIQADALVDFAKHILGCDQNKLPGHSNTVVVRIDSQDLVPSGVVANPSDAPFDAETNSPAGTPLEAMAGPYGVTDEAPSSDRERNHATLDGGTVIDFTTARQIAAAAGLIPAVLGTDGATLDMGREVRHFTRYQRLALVERDGGCAFCGLPPGMTEAHHLRWWSADHGKTDLDNGVLLCTSCHHRVHQGWEIRITHGEDHPPGVKKRGGTVWFLPPSNIDHQRAPRLGGRKRFDLAYRAANPPIPIPEFRSNSWVSHISRLVE